MAIGPVQILVVGFGDAEFKGTIREELARLKDQDIVRLIDLIAVRKDRSGAIAVLSASDLDWEEASQYGAYVGRLIGFGAGGAEGADRGAMAGAASALGMKHDTAIPMAQKHAAPTANEARSAGQWPGNVTP